MSWAKKVAIIGAGPSGLVTAKTLLHHYPKGRFETVIFDSKPTVGGLWAVTKPDATTQDDCNQQSADFVDCFMRTNLSRFTVSFSDHAWNKNSGSNNKLRDDGGDNMFPQAWEVGEYLKGYADRFLSSDDILRLSCRVVRTQRNPDPTTQRRWTVEWIEEKKNTQSRGGDGGEDSLRSESFDYLVIASGYFSRPYIPDGIAGLDEFPPGRVIHSSSLRSESSLRSSSLLRFCSPSKGGKILVVGGSMSGAEAAASIALDLSTAGKSTSTSTSSTWSVHHICPRPFWVVPTHLPTNDQPGSFLPLDIVMNDLARRPPGDIQYSLAPMTPDRANIVHKYFESLIGSNQSDIANALHQQDRDSPPWVAITDHYSEFVRAGDIVPTLGRVSAARCIADAHTEAGEVNGVVEVENRGATGQGEKITIDNVAAIVLATGFTPFDSLSFLPEDVLTALEFSQKNTVFPIVLDEKGTWNPNVPDLGFVGMYRGPYWGVVEMQARTLARKWDQENAEYDDDIAGLSKFRDLRTTMSSSLSPPELRLQFPMGDYVGLMETFARELGIQRTPLAQDESERSGPVAPARYFVPASSSNPTTAASTSSSNDIIVSHLQTLLQPSSEDRQRALGKAVLRALHGKWGYERTVSTQTSTTTTASSGQASIHPCKAPDANSGSRTEYVYEELSSSEKESSATTIFQLSKDHFIYTTRDYTLSPVGRIEFVAVEGEKDGYQYRHLAREIPAFSTNDAEAKVEREGVSREYTFNMRGVIMTSWEERVEDRRLKTVRVTRYYR